jgi:hypothetical protein
VVGGVKKMMFRKITKEAHVRYEYFDVDSNMSFWDAYSNQLVSVGKSSLSTNGVVFVGTGTQKIVFTNNEIRGVSSESDLRVLSNGILMARNEFSGEWEVRGKVFNTDIYLRGGKPGRYKWDDKTKSYRLIFTGRALSRDIGLDEKGRGVAAPRQTRTAASSRIRMRQRQKETREKASVSKEDVVTSAEVEEKSGWNLPSFLGINRK